MSTNTYLPVETEELIQGSGVYSEGTSKVITAGQHVAVGKGKGSIIIGAATEAIDAPGGGANALNGHESGVLDLDDDNDNCPKFGYHAVAKVRMDNEPLLKKRRPLSNATAYKISSQPETSFGSAMSPEPGSIERTFFDFAGHPGVPIITISGDMVVWKNGIAYEVIVIDGKRWGKALTYLEDK